MSKRERQDYPPPASSSRYHRSSLTPHQSHKGAGLGSSSTKIQVVGDAYNPQERGYDSEAVRDSTAPQTIAGYHTEGQPSTGKRTSKDLYRTALDPGRRTHGSRTSSMPAVQPQQPSFGYPYDVRHNVDNSTPYTATAAPDGEDSAAEQNSSLHRVKKERRHRDRDQPEARAVPASVWMQQVAPPPDAKPSRSGKRESRSARTRHDETPQQVQSDLPRTLAQTGSAPQDYHRHPQPQPPYAYAQQPVNGAPYRPANATPVPPPPHQDYYRPSTSTPAPPDHYATLAAPTAQNQAQTKPRYEYVIDDRAGLRSPPPFEIPHAFAPETPYDHYAYAALDSPALPLPRNLAQLKADGLVPASPAPTYRKTHRSTRSEDVTAAGVFGDGLPTGSYAAHAEHARPPLRHRPSRSELGLGQAPGVLSPDEHETLVRPVHVGRSASETIVPQQLPTPALFGAGLAVTTARGAPAPGERGGILMHPQLQESFAESANASRAPVNAAMANAAVHVYSNGPMESDSSSAKDKETSSRRTVKREKKPRRASKQSEVVSQPQPQPADTAYPEPSRQAQAEVGRQIVMEPSPPPMVLYPTGRRSRTTSGKSMAQDVEPEPEPDTVVYQSPEETSGTNPRRASRTSLVGPRGDALLGSRGEMTFAGAGAALGANGPRGDGGYETRGPNMEVITRRGSVVENTEERVRRPSIEARRAEEERTRAVTMDERGRRPSDPSRLVEGNSIARKSMGSEESFQSYESAVLAASTAATNDAFYPAAEYASTRDAMSPRSNYYSVAASVKSVNEARSVVSEARNMTNEARAAGDVNNAGTTMAMQPSLTSKAPLAPSSTYRPSESRQGGVRTSAAPSTASGFPISIRNPSAPPNVPPKASAPVPPTPTSGAGPNSNMRPSGEPEMHGRPRTTSGSVPAPTVDFPPHRATIDAHVRDNVPQTAIVDEEGRLNRGPVVSQTMPTRAPRHSLTMQRQSPPQGIVTPVASPPQPHAQAHPSDPQASALPRNLLPQPNGSSKESLVDVKSSSKNKPSSRWFQWSKSKTAETPQKVSQALRAQTPSPGPTIASPPPPVTQSQRVRHPSILGNLMMGNPSSSKNKASHKAPEPAPRHSTEIYQSQESTPSSITLEIEPEITKKDESRVPRMFTTLKNTLRRTPSTAKISHGLSRSMSRLPGTSREAVAAPTIGVPLTRSASAKDSIWPMSPQRAKEPLRGTKDGLDTAPPPPVVPAPTPAPVAAPALPKERVASKEQHAPEAVPVKDDRRQTVKEVQIIEKSRAPLPNAPRTPAPVEHLKSSRMVDASGRLVDSSGRPFDGAGRPSTDSMSRGAPGQRSSVQAPPPSHPRAASPPLVSRPVAATRMHGSSQTSIFTSPPQPRPSTQPTPAPLVTHTSSRTQPRDRSRSSRDPGPASGNLRTPRPRDAIPIPVTIEEPAATVPELGLPTPDDTPRSSPTGGAMFDSHNPPVAAPAPRERNRPLNIVVPPNLNSVNHKLAADKVGNGALLKFDHRQKRAVSIASLEAVTGQEGHFRSEASSIRTVTPGPGQTSFPNRDPLMAAEDWTEHQLQEDMRLSGEKLAARRESIARRSEAEPSGRKHRGGLKRSKAGPRKPGVAFDFPGPVIDEDGEEKEDPRQQDIELTYELERIKKRYK